MTLQDLNEHYKKRLKLAKNKEMLENILAAAYPNQQLTGMPFGTSTSDKVGDLGAEIAYIEERTALLENEIKKDEYYILGFIDSIQDEQLHLILSLRFIRCLKWREVAEIIGGGNTKDGVRQICFRYFD